MSDTKVDKDIALFIHANHDAVIKDLKERQWKIFRWTIAVYASVVLLNLREHNIFSDISCFVVAGLLVTLFIFVIVIWHTQDGLKTRRKELAHLKQTWGAAYKSLRTKKKENHVRLLYDWQVWISMIGLNIMVCALAIYVTVNK